MNENLSKAELNELNLDVNFGDADTDADVNVDKKRDKKTRRRLRHKKSKLSIDDVTADDRQRRKSTTSRRPDAKPETKSRRPNIILIMTDDQVGDTYRGPASSILVRPNLAYLNPTVL